MCLSIYVEREGETETKTERDCYIIINSFAKFHQNLLRKFEVIAYIYQVGYSLDVHNPMFFEHVMNFCQLYE